MIARDYGFTRDALDQFALDSHRKAAAASAAGAFDREIVVLDVNDKDGAPQRHAADEAAVHTRIRPPVPRRLQDAEYENRDRRTDRHRARDVERWCIALA